jgi:class 3 adenylate cyclase/pimeloyl-ACP methyl ester carboxylesterase
VGPQSEQRFERVGSVVCVLEAPETRYASSGRLSIAYQVVGEGSPEILLVPGFVSNLEAMWDVPWIVRILERLASVACFVMFDKRGTGLSDRTLGSGSAEERMDDLRAVADAAEIEQPMTVGLSEGGPLALLFATTYPERVRSLVLWETFARALGAPDYAIGIPVEVADAFVATVEREWGTGHALRHFIQCLPEDDATYRAMGRYERQSATPGMAADVLSHNIRIDVRAALSAVQVPTLVVHRTDDPLVPVALGRYLAREILGARLAELPGEWHVNGRVGGDDDVFDAINAFFTGEDVARERQLDRVLATVLFTDIVDSTGRALDVGDRSWRAMLEQHDHIARRQVERFGGTFVSRTGDGVLATFDGPGRAVRAAHGIINAVKPLSLGVRAGVHTCEIELRDGDVAGIGVHVGARVGALAAPDEVLVSNTVKELVMGSEINFADRGVHELKGVPGDWQLWAAK